MKTIAVFYASEGTGHKTAAQNLRDEFLRENPDGRVLCRDILDYIPSWLHRLVSDGYLQMARRAPWLWGQFYWGSDKQSIRSASFDWFHKTLCRRYLPALERDAAQFGAQAVFFTHYFGAPCFAEWYKNYPTFYVNTDFVCHRFQRGKMYRALFVASPTAVKQHADEGIQNVYDTGIPVSPKFLELPSKERARKRLGLEPERKTILVSGGGIGAGAVEAATATLAARKDWKIIVICGNNRALYRKLSARYAANENVRAEAFVPDMENYYRAADLGVMKPGGLSLSEALASKLPLLFMDPIPGQEQLNMDYVCGRGAARALANANEAQKEAAALLDAPEELEKLAKAMEEISRPQAAKEILRISSGLL
ncbi:MAG: glycosyltransferase [Synergistaceae bacterium]|nr:glycosyltransferase [Synergistaceae bacterium]